LEPIMSIHKVYKRSQEDLYAKGHGRQGKMMINHLPNLHHVDIQNVMSNLLTATYLMVFSLKIVINDLHTMYHNIHYDYNIM
jgi:hypothetical protein